MPWPPYPRTMPYRPALRTAASIAAEISVRRPRPVRGPRAPAAIPAHIPSWATPIIRAIRGSISPTPTVTAASPKQVLREGDVISIDCGAILDGDDVALAQNLLRRRD